MIQKIKNLIVGCVSLFLLILVVLMSIALFKSTNKTYVCTGTVQEYNKHPYTTNVLFEIENSFSIYGNEYMRITSMLNDSPFAFSYSNMQPYYYNSFRWGKTYYGKDLDIFVSAGNQLITFNFYSKILNAVFWDKSGNVKLADFNLICKEVK